MATLTASQRDKVNDSGSCYVTSDASVYQDGAHAGLLQVRTTGHNDVKARGYTIGYMINLRDAADVILYKTQPRKRGVDGKWFGGNHFQDDWSEDVGAMIAAQTHRIEFIQGHASSKKVLEAVGQFGINILRNWLFGR